MSLIEVKGLTKSYGDVHAVRGVDLSIEQGEIFSILGPNGAGKTTTVEILEGFRFRDSGSVSVLGFDPSTNPVNGETVSALFYKAHQMLAI
jgi:ABC-2 type transport system ATP-binding protein